MLIMDVLTKWESLQTPVLAAVGIGFVTCLIIVVSDYLYGRSLRKQLGDIPIVGEKSDVCSLLSWRSPEFDIVKETADAYQQYTKNGKPWAMKLVNRFYWVILPPQTAREWGYLPLDHLNFVEVIDKVNMHHHHTNMASQTVTNAVIKCNKQPYLDAFCDLFAREVHELIPSAFPMSDSQKGWGEINVSERLLYINSRSMIACILGPEFAPDSRLLELFMSYNVLISSHTTFCIRFPRALHGLISRFAPANRKLWEVIRELKSILIPEIRRQICQMRSKESQNKSWSLLNAVIEECMIEDTISRGTSYQDEEKQVSVIAERIMFLHFETALPIAFLVTSLIYRIMTNPEYIIPLREELQAALPARQCTAPNVMNQCPKLESFMRETLRVNGVIAYASSRMVMRPVYIPSLGRTFPPGLILSLPWHWMSRDQDLYPNPDKFDSDRFYNGSSGTCTPRVTTTSDKFLTFGYGSNPCPGRFMATRFAQIVFTKILMGFDVTCMPDQQEFPLNFHRNGFFLVNYEVQARIRPRL
ncbi:cytochrome P450 [Aspergillus taichungensis]|uniref:Cytochrome P450 n=1 Tax=Aspergillus taichungensis TaxID=482145 RepID=A0A2J5HHD3_9EURO|nr:cytochrome P450 [Aspergillus taichungensis]